MINHIREDQNRLSTEPGARRRLDKNCICGLVNPSHRVCQWGWVVSVYSPEYCPEYSPEHSGRNCFVDSKSTEAFRPQSHPLEAERVFWIGCDVSVLRSRLFCFCFCFFVFVHTRKNDLIHRSNPRKKKKKDPIPILPLNQTFAFWSLAVPQPIY